MTLANTLAAAAAATAIAFPVLAQDRVYDLEGFTRIDASAGLTVDVTVGPDFAVEAEALRGNIDRLEVSVRGDRLILSRESRLFTLGREDRFVVTVTLPALEAVNVSSGTSATVEAGAASRFVADVSSGADLEITGLEAGAVVASSSSGARMEISGACDTLDASSSSGSTLRAGDLQCAAVSARASSGSSLSVFADETVSADGSSGASIRISGNPRVDDIDLSSGADVDFR